MDIVIKALSVVLVLLFLYSTWVEPSGLRIRSERLRIRKNLRRPVRVLFLSDIHLGLFMPRRWMEKKLEVVAKSHQEHPYDLIILGGDYIDRNRKYIPQLKKFLAVLASLNVPRYAVLGNHDCSYASIDSEEVVATLKAEGVTVLRNEAAVFEGGAGTLGIVGLNDLETSSVYLPSRRQESHAGVYGERAQAMDWYRQFQGVAPEAVRILVSHNPDGAYLPGDPRPDVVCAGHTHGGQVVFMALLQRILYFAMPRGSFQGFAGRTEVNGSTVLISSGFGGSFLPFRLLRRPEAIFLEITPD